MNVTNCSTGWSRTSDLRQFTDCVVSIETLNIIRLVSIAVSLVLFLIELVSLVLRRSVILSNKRLVLVLIGWTLLEPLIMLVRPFTLYFTTLNSYDSLLMGLITYLSAASIAGIAILFIYIEVRLLQKSVFSMNSAVPIQLNYKKGVLTGAGIVQTVAFGVGPFINVYGDITAAITFWVPVILVDFLVIPYFCYLGILIYQRVVTTKPALARRLLIIVVVCGLLSLSTGGMAILGVTQLLFFDWLFLDLSWPLATMFAGMICYLFIRKTMKKPRVVVTDKLTKTKSNH